ncbi:hypothetical protein SAMN05660880_00299 [Luteibacter sp. 22Crub2.1]|nr:hypothetical protein SAMN05660880_00299 [Luteibacter sp. 22Crub2.1]
MISHHVPAPDRQAEIISRVAQVIVAALLRRPRWHYRTLRNTDRDVRVVAEDNGASRLAGRNRRKPARSGDTPIVAKQPGGGELSPGLSFSAPAKPDVNIQFPPPDEPGVVDVGVKIEPHPLALDVVQRADVRYRHSLAIDSSDRNVAQRAHRHRATGQCSRQRGDEDKHSRGRVARWFQCCRSCGRYREATMPDSTGVQWTNPATVEPRQYPVAFNRFLRVRPNRSIDEAHACSQSSSCRG